jgi:hypothetical protein
MAHLGHLRRKQDCAAGSADPIRNGRRCARARLIQKFPKCDPP